MKRILACLLVLAMVFSLAACDKKDSNNDNKTTDAPATTSAPATSTNDGEYVSSILQNAVELTLWDIAVEGDGNRPAYDAAMADLKAKYPNVKIVETVTENEAYKTKIKAAVGSNELPDIFFTWAGAFLGDFVDAGKVHCLDDVLKKYVDNGELPEAMLGNSTYGGKQR